MHAQYSIQDQVVQVQWHDERFGRLVEDLGRYCGFPPAARLHLDPSLHLILVDTGGGTLPRVRGEHVTQLDQVDVWRHRDTLYLRAEGLHMEIRLEAGTGVLWIEAPSDERLEAIRPYVFYLLYLSLVVLLRRQGRYALHAAAVAREGHAFLFVAPSDCGKSTLSYSLVREGWDSLSDDTVLLEETPAGIMAAGFRKNYALDLEAQTVFPELRGPMERQLSEATKLCLPMARLHPTRQTEYAAPVVLLFPEIADRPDSVLLPVSSADAMWRVLDQSALLTLEPDQTTSQTTLVRRLVVETRHVRLLAGRDLKADPARVAALLAPLLASQPLASCTAA